MKVIYFISFIVLSLFLQPVSSGHIFSQPSEIIPQNFKYASTIHLFFSLETSLVVGDYIVLKFPFNVGAPTAGISVSLDTSAATLYTLTRDSGTDPEHFFQVSNQLLSGQWYRLRVNFGSSSLGSQTSGPQGCINMQTASSNSVDRIVYDNNVCLDYISLGPSVDTTIFKVFGSYTYTQASVVTNFGQSYTAFFDVFPNVEVEEGAIITLTLAGSSFSFGSSCTTVACLIGSTNPDCPTTYNYNMTQMPGTCSSNGQVLTFNLNQKVTINPFRIQATIVNPNALASSSVTAVYKSKKAETWFATTSILAATVNPLNLMTTYPTITASSTVSLFWGVQFSTVTTTSNFLGCPMVLYRTSSLITVVNSMKTAVSISTTINSFKSLNYLNIVWYPTEISESNVLLSSIQSNFPVVSGTRSLCSIVSTIGVNCTNIDTLNTGSSYTISGKLILNAAANGPASTNCGKVEFYRGDLASSKLGTSTTQSVAIKTNKEYFDNREKGNAEHYGFHKQIGYALLTGYNVFGSYSVAEEDLSNSNTNRRSLGTGTAATDATGAAEKAKSDTQYFVVNAKIIALVETISKLFYAKTTGIENKGKPGVFARPASSSSSDNYGLFMLLATKSPYEICYPSALGIASSQESCFPGLDDVTTLIQVWVMLKIVFNNNVLNINSAEFSKGVQIVGTLFGVMTPADGILTVTPFVDLNLELTGQSVVDYGGTNSANRNFITQSSNYWHVTLICKPIQTTYLTGQNDMFVNFDNCKNVLQTYVSASAAGTGAGAAAGLTLVNGISFLQTNIRAYPSQYVDEYVFDFVQCWKCTKAGANGWNGVTLNELEWIMTEGKDANQAGMGDGINKALAAVPAGPTLYNAYVITGAVTDYRSSASFVNYYSDGGNAAAATFGTNAYYASYIRVLANFATSDLSTSGSSVSIFLNGERGASAGTTFDSLKFFSNSFNEVNMVDHQNGVSTVATIFKGWDETIVEMPADVNVPDGTWIRAQTTAVYVASTTAFKPAITALPTGSAAAAAATKVFLRKDFWQVKSGFTYSSSVQNTNNGGINCYFPIKTGFISLNSVHIAIRASNTQTGTSSIIAVFRVFGSVWKGVIKSLPAYPALALGTPAFPDDFTQNYYSPGAANGCYSTSVKTFIKSISSSSDFLPSKTYTSGVGFQAQVDTPAGTTCLVSKGSDLLSYASLTELTDLSNVATTLPVNFGAAFIVYSRDVKNIFNPASTLTFVGNTNKCIFHNLPFQVSGVATTYYTIFCQAEKSAGGTDAGFGASTDVVTLGTFTVPFYWGSKAAGYGDKLQYVWSNYLGVGVYVAKDVASTSTWVNKACLISLNTGIPKDTMDVSYTLTLTNVVTYALDPSGSSGVDNVVVTENFINAIDSSKVNFALCEFPNNANILCSITQSSVYTLKNTNTASSTSITSISINVIVDTNGQTMTTHWASISFNGALIETCSEATPLAFQVDGTQGLSSITFGSSTDFKYTNMKTARGSFFFTFSFARIIRANNVFTFNLGFFANPTQLSKNFRCQILNSNGIISNNFQSLTTSDLSKSYVTVKTTMISGGSLRYKCLGAQTTDYSTGTTVPITATYSRSGINAALPIASTINPITPGLIPPDSVAINSVSFSKLFKSKGFDAEYVISFIPSSTNITYTGRIIVEFPSCVPPRLNYAGVLNCYLNENPVFCEFIEERRVSIWPNLVLYKTSIEPYTVRITHVTQPNSGDVILNPQVYLALDNDDNVFNGIAEQSFITDTFDSSTSPPKIIYMHDFSYTQNKIRSTTSVSVVLNLPANTLALGNYIYIQMPASFDKSLFYSPNAGCALRRVNDATNVDFARSCSLVRGRKLILFVNTDSLNNIELNYTLTISNLMTPQQPSSVTNLFREDIRVFLSPDNQTVTYTTAAGNRNTTVYFNWQVDNTVILLKWLNTQGGNVGEYVDVNIGNYQVAPSIATSGGPFNNTFNWQFSGSNSSSFVIQQIGSSGNNLVIKSGFATSKFYIAAKESTPPGKYYLSTLDSGDTYNAYSALPYLDIRVVLSSCSIIPSVSSISIPAGGYSLPIILDFSNCPPVTDLSVLANLTTGANLYLTFANGQTSHSQNLKFEQINSNYRLYYYLNSGNPFNNLTSGAASIGFSLTGTDAPYFDISSTIAVSIIPPVTETPIVQTPTVTNSPGAATVSLSCSQTGNIYFAIGIKNSILAVTQKIIQENTQNKLIDLTIPDANDEEYKLYGYIAYGQNNVFRAVNINGRLKAGENYTVVSYCVNQNSISSNRSERVTWIQADNGGKTVAVNIVFKNQDISAAQKLEIACGLTRFFAIPPARVKTDEGFSCNTLRMLQNTVVSNTSNNSNVTNVSTYYTYHWFIIKDYFASQDNMYQNVQSEMRDPAFTSKVFGLTSFGAQGFPTVNATSNLVIDAYSTSGSTVPIIQASTEIANWFSIGISLTLTNVQGYVYCGVGNSTVKAPTLSQLRFGLDGDNSALIGKKYSYLDNNTMASFNFTNLNNNTNYTLFWGGSNLDTSINAVSSGVFTRLVSTTPPPWQAGSLLHVSLVLVGLLMVIMTFA